MCHAFRRVTQSGEHTHGSGLSGAVGTQETKDFSFMNAERDMIDGGETSETLGKSVHFDDVFLFLFCLAMLQACRTKYI